jgi:hypothetical protein
MNVKPKDDDDQMMGRRDADDQPLRKPGGVNAAVPMRRQQINANVDWNLYVKNLEKVSREELVDSMSKILLQVKSSISNDVISQYSDATARENFIKSATIQIMSTPEYQLC